MSEVNGLPLSIKKNKTLSFLNMNRKAVLSGSIFGALAVVLGALGAHALKSSISSEALDSFTTGVRYQMYHAILLIIIGLSSAIPKTKLINATINLLIIGIILFSFSIYLLSTRELTALENISFLGPITPLGGLCLISAWICLFFTFLNYKK